MNLRFPALQFRDLVFQLQFPSLQLRHSHVVGGEMYDRIVNLALESLMLALELGQMVLQRHLGTPGCFESADCAERIVAKLWHPVAC